MKSTRMLPGAAAAFILSWATACAEREQRQGNDEKATYAVAERLTYREVTPGASGAAVWGEPEKGAHSSFTRFVPGFDAGMHSHTNDVSIVVLKGAYLYRDEAGEKRVEPGHFLRVPGGHQHWSGGDTKEGALFYNHSSGKFDLVAAK